MTTTSDRPDREQAVENPPPSNPGGAGKGPVSSTPITAADGTVVLNVPAPSPADGVIPVPPEAVLQFESVREQQANSSGSGRSIGVPLSFLDGCTRCDTLSYQQLHDEGTDVPSRVRVGWYPLIDDNGAGIGACKLCPEHEHGVHGTSNALGQVPGVPALIPDGSPPTVAPVLPDAEQVAAIVATAEAAATQRPFDADYDRSQRVTRPDGVTPVTGAVLTVTGPDDESQLADEERAHEATEEEAVRELHHSPGFPVDNTAYESRKTVEPAVDDEFEPWPDDDQAKTK